MTAQARWGHLSDDTTLVRFMSLPKLQGLVDRRLWLPSLQTLAKLNDPNEGDLDGNFKLCPGLYDHDERLMDYARKHKEISSRFDSGDLSQARVLAWLHYLRHHRAASCWFQGPSESYPMWEAYAKNGVAVETTVGDLRKAIGTDNGEYRLERVLYYDSGLRIPSVSPDDLREGKICPCFLKPRAFEGEREIRLICRIPFGAPGCEFKIGLPFQKWINRVIIYPHADYSVFEEAKAIVQKIVGANFPAHGIHPSEIRRRSYRFPDFAFGGGEPAETHSTSSLDETPLGCWPGQGRNTLQE